MVVLSIESGPVATIGYLVYDSVSHECVVIDVPPDSYEFFMNKINDGELILKAILLTHSHWDHTADCPKLKKATNAPVLIFKEDEYRIISPMETSVWPLPFAIDSMKADAYLTDGMIINFGNLEIQTLFTPGHTEGGACFLINAEKTIFTGDTLFNLSVGRVDLPGGNYEQLMRSINEKLMTLEDDYKVYCGHGYSTTIGFERSNNQFLINE